MIILFIPANLQVLRYLSNRTLAHRNAINFCQNILKQKLIEWKAVFRSDLSKPIHDVDMVITVGGDGTLLQASHLMDDSIPVLGVNSDPTQPNEVTYLSFCLARCLNVLFFILFDKDVLI